MGLVDHLKNNVKINDMKILHQFSFWRNHMKLQNDTFSCGAFTMFFLLRRGLDAPGVMCRTEYVHEKLDEFLEKQLEREGGISRLRPALAEQAEQQRLKRLRQLERLEQLDDSALQ